MPILMTPPIAEAPNEALVDCVDCGGTGYAGPARIATCVFCEGFGQLVTTVSAEELAALAAERAEHEEATACPTPA